MVRSSEERILLEREYMDAREEKEYREITANPLIQAGSRVLLHRLILKEIGQEKYLGKEPLTEKEAQSWKRVLKIPLEEREELLDFMKKYPHLSDEELGKHLLKESEFFPD